MAHKCRYDIVFYLSLDGSRPYLILFNILQVILNTFIFQEVHIRKEYDLLIHVFHIYIFFSLSAI